MLAHCCIVTTEVSLQYNCSHGDVSRRPCSVPRPSHRVWSTDRRLRQDTCLLCRGSGVKSLGGPLNRSTPAPYTNPRRRARAPISTWSQDNIALNPKPASTVHERALLPRRQTCTGYQRCPGTRAVGASAAAPFMRPPGVEEPAGRVAASCSSR